LRANQILAVLVDKAPLAVFLYGCMAAAKEPRIFELWINRELAVGDYITPVAFFANRCEPFLKPSGFRELRRNLEPALTIDVSPLIPNLYIGASPSRNPRADIAFAAAKLFLDSLLNCGFTTTLPVRLMNPRRLS
jgi:hypothetical protein